MHPHEHSDDAKNDVGGVIKEDSTWDALGQVGDVGKGKVARRIMVESKQIFVII